MCGQFHTVGLQPRLACFLSTLPHHNHPHLHPCSCPQLFSLLESDFNPLQLCKVVAPLLEQLATLNQPVTGASVCLVCLSLAWMQHSVHACALWQLFIPTAASVACTCSD